jgi:HK97 family phage major capsid protein
MRQYAKTVTLTEGNVWHGVTTAGVTASWDGELVEVSDDTPSVGTQSITIYKAQGFIQASSTRSRTSPASPRTSSSCSPTPRTGSRARPT